MLFTKNKRLRQLAAGLETGNWLLVKLWLRKPSAARTFPSRMFRDFVYLAGGGRWPARDLWEIFPKQRNVRVSLECLPPCGIGTPLEDLLYLALVTKVLSPRKIFEIGTFRGRSTLNFALNSPEDCVIYTLDLPPDGRTAMLESEVLAPADKKVIGESQTGVDYRESDVAHKIVQLYGDSRAFNYSPFYGQMDLVFVDALKHYAAVRHDTEEALKMVRAGGAIIWHAFANYGDYHDVTRAVLDCLPASEVIQIANTDLVLYLSQPGCSPDGAEQSVSAVRGA